MKVFKHPYEQISETARVMLQNNIDNDEEFADAFFEWNDALGNHAFTLGVTCTLAVVTGVCLGAFTTLHSRKKKQKK